MSRLGFRPFYMWASVCSYEINTPAPAFVNWPYTLSEIWHAADKVLKKYNSPWKHQFALRARALPSSAQVQPERSQLHRLRIRVFIQLAMPGGSLQAVGSSPHGLGQKELAQLQQAPSQLFDWWLMPSTQRDLEKQGNPAPSLGFADRNGNTGTDFAVDDRSHKQGGWELLQRPTELPCPKYSLTLKWIFMNFEVQNSKQFLSSSEGQESSMLASKSRARVNVLQNGKKKNTLIFKSVHKLPGKTLKMWQ